MDLHGQFDGKGIVDKPIKLSLHHKRNDSEKKRPLSRRFVVILKNVGPTVFKITQM